MPPLALATSVDDVRRLLAQCLQIARDENSADAYFPLLYSWETEDIATAADAGSFEAPETLRRMLVAFANRYFSARERFRRSEPTPKAWALAFRAARTSSALVVQHLLLAINAHVNVDLAAAAAEVDVGWADYARVDRILGDGVERIQRGLNRTTRVLCALDRFGGRIDEMFTVFSLKAARRCAYENARELLAAPASERDALIARADDAALRIGERLLEPPLRDRLLLAALRLTELNQSPRQLLATLERR